MKNIYVITVCLFQAAIFLYSNRVQAGSCVQSEYYDPARKDSTQTDKHTPTPPKFAGDTLFQDKDVCVFINDKTHQVNFDVGIPIETAPQEKDGKYVTYIKASCAPPQTKPGYLGYIPTGPELDQNCSGEQKVEFDPKSNKLTIYTKKFWGWSTDQKHKLTSISAREVYETTNRNWNTNQFFLNNDPNEKRMSPDGKPGKIVRVGDIDKFQLFFVPETGGKEKEVELDLNADLMHMYPRIPNTEGVDSVSALQDTNLSPKPNKGTKLTNFPSKGAPLENTNSEQAPEQEPKDHESHSGNGNQ